MRAGRRALRPLAALGVALLATAGGCYEYRPAAAGAVPMGRAVEVELTDSGSVVVARTVGPAVEAIAGTLVADSADELVLAVARVRRRDAGASPWGGERVRVPRPLVARVRTRQLSRTRSVLAGAAVAAGLLAARAAFAGLGGSNAGRGQGPGSGSPK